MSNLTRRLGLLIVGLAVLSATGCPVLHDPEELLEETNLRVLVTSVPVGDEVVFEIADQHGSAFAHEDGVVEFHFTLDPGTYDAAITILIDEEPAHCGIVEVEVADADETFSVDTHSLAQCDAA